ncbi:NEFA-interacting nuclear protein NIP30, putative [Metarhizium acridum CQMa 102]|uniref:NEFA-interacting nuclear protein NIP30, putative n=1 Tax=Metarhizium acridum (strain CQMa 102) TaxID=655827 RepID=E9E2T7_METAQ|nr:NEFA-interacting nuclear protein NIP30, putative [Metarhizium acridum CQMa 102]EFY89753.1 NEFA-interacting nuclear protein NIP30, putative [Metarhizium acridum CQMa 102]
MSNRFVSGGTINTCSDPEAKEAVPRAQLAKSTEWEAVQQELENDRKSREEQRLKAAAGEERSLYDVLQANKAAKQAAFEEQNKIRNQFRALDDDEIEFLDEVVAAKRKEEERVRRETEDGVRAYRDLQRRSSGGEAVGEGHDEGDDWGVGRKRKRKRRDREKAVVKRKADGGQRPAESPSRDVKPAGGNVETDKKTPVEGPAKKGALVDYGSDSDE